MSTEKLIFALYNTSVHCKGSHQSARKRSMVWWCLCDVIIRKQSVIVVRYQGFHFACYENKENLSRIIFKRAIASSSHVGVSSYVKEKQLCWCTLIPSSTSLFFLFLRVPRVKQNEKTIYVIWIVKNKQTKILSFGINLIYTAIKQSQ